MVEALHLWSLVPATVGTCCLIGDRRARISITWVPALVMLVAMLDVALGTALVHPVVWVVVLVVMSAWPAVAHRAVRSVGGADMAVHRSLGTLVMAGLLMGHGEAVGHHGMGPGLGVLVVLGYLGFTLGLAVHTLRTSRAGALPALEVISMGLSVALMSGAALA